MRSKVKQDKSALLATEVFGSYTKRSELCKYSTQEYIKFELYLPSFSLCTFVFPDWDVENNDFCLGSWESRVGMVTRLDSSPKLQDKCSAYSASCLVGTKVLSMWNSIWGGGLTL